MNASSYLACSLLVLLGGCTSFAMSGADREALHSGTMVEDCPLGVPWTRVQAHDTPAGLDVAFDTSSTKVVELRRRVRDQAAANGPDRHRGSGHDGEHGGPRAHGLQLWTIADLRASVEDTPAGAKLVLASSDAGRRDELRRRVNERIARIQGSGCPR